MAEMTKSQKATLRAAILAEPALADELAVRDDAAITAYCNAPALPAQKVWKDKYTSRELFEATALTDYIARSAAERQAFDLLISVGVVSPEKNKIRAAVADIFSGATNNGSRAAILTDMTRDATWTEKLLGGSDATTSAITAWKANWLGTLSPYEVSTLLNG